MCSCGCVLCFTCVGFCELASAATQGTKYALCVHTCVHAFVSCMNLRVGVFVYVFCGYVLDRY